MRPSKIWGWLALVDLTLLVACGGVSKIGRGDGSDAGAGGGAPVEGGSGTGATATAGGKDPGMLPGTGAASGLQPCKEDAVCPGFGEACESCPDGSRVCNDGYCDGAAGICRRKGGSCASKCLYDTECPVPDLACPECADGTLACPTSQCLMGVCQLSYPGCGVDPCKGLACGSGCNPCPPDGACDAKGASFCNSKGSCQPGPPDCGTPGSCETAMDCGAPPPNCYQCTDGTCATYDCLANKCGLSCPSSRLMCKYVEDCPPLNDGECTMCPNGKCAVQVCLKNACQLACPVQ